MIDPKRYIVQIQDSLLAEFLYHWTVHGKPCPLLFQRPHTDGLTAIRLEVRDDDTAYFLADALAATGCKLYEK